jgi:hypothetical protein
MSAIHIAEQAGATKILLLGMDPEIYDANTGIFLTAGLKQLTAELQAKGIAVERIKTLEDVREHAPPTQEPGESRPTATLRGGFFSPT